MKKLLSFLVILGLVCYGAFKGAVWYQTDQALRDVRDRLSETGVLEWSGIGSSVTGKVRLEGVSWKPFALATRVDVESLELTIGSPLDWWSLMSAGTLPDQWHLSVDDIVIPLRQDMLRDWMAPETRERWSSWIKIPCGSDSLRVADLRDMGITRITGDASLDRAGASRPVTLEIDTDSLGSLDAALHGRLFERLRADLSESVSTPARVDLVLRDGGFMRRFSAWCARQQKIEVDAWSSRVVTALEQSLVRRHLQPSAQLSALTRTWIRKGGLLEMALSPSEGLVGIPVFQPGESTEAAGLPVTYNEQQVPDVYLHRMVPLVSPTEASEKESADASSKGEGDQGPSYQSVDLSRASQWLGHQVRIELNNGRVVEGRLSSVSDESLDVARIVDGGEVVYPLARSAIKLMEVWRRTPSQ